MWRRGLGAAIMVCLAVTESVAMAAPGPPPGPDVTAPGHRRCGGWELFQHRFQVEAHGIGCAQARRVLSRPCAIRLNQRWSCFSFRDDEPFIAWFPTEDLFERRWDPAVLLRRYPCAQAKVTPSLFGVLSKGFPTRRQLLADDVLRCKMLEPGDSPLEVEQMLGPAAEEEAEGGRQWLVYDLGPERDSLVQVDSELLIFEIRRDRVRSLSIVQS